MLTTTHNAMQSRYKSHDSNTDANNKTISPLAHMRSLLPIEKLLIEGYYINLSSSKFT